MLREICAATFWKASVLNLALFSLFWGCHFRHLADVSSGREEAVRINPFKKAPLRALLGVKGSAREAGSHSSRWCGQLEDFKNTLGCVCACAEGLRWQNVTSRIYAWMRIMSLRQVQWSKQHFVRATCPYYLVSKGHIEKPIKKMNGDSLSGSSYPKLKISFHCKIQERKPPFTYFFHPKDK